MNNKRTWIEKLSDFISGKGFYLVVLICVAAIALSGYYLVQGMRGSLDSALDQPVTGSAAIRETPSASPTPRPSAKPAGPSAAPSSQVTPPPAISAPPASAAPAPLVFTWPVKGTVDAGFVVETLVYNETMGDWRTHSGLDITADLGAKVLATANGTVSAVYQDDLMGTVVEIDHGDGLVSLYANLTEAPTVSAGDAVTTGAVIGSVGQTAAAESGQTTHLHFAMYQDDTPVDPAGYLPEN